MNILIVSGHPKLSHSNANRRILEKLIDLPNITISDVHSNYPEGKIDVQAEQQQLREASLIILQFPFVWYGMPAHMRQWMETVFATGFAHGEGGNALRNKRLLLSITLGGSQEAYCNRGQHRYPVEAFLRPVEMFARYCGMEYLEPVYSYGMVENRKIPGDMLAEKVDRHVRCLVQVIQSVNKELIQAVPFTKMA